MIISKAGTVPPQAKLTTRCIRNTLLMIKQKHTELHHFGVA